MFQLLWSVVEFADDLEESAAVEVIPTIWIIVLNNNITCKWPDKNSRKAIKKCETPKSSWKTYQIKTILFQTGNIYYHYITIFSSKEYFSCYRIILIYRYVQDCFGLCDKKTQTDTDVSVQKVGQRKRRIKKKNQDDFTTDFSENESQRMTPPPTLPTQCGTLVRILTIRSWRLKLNNWMDIIGITIHFSDFAIESRNEALQISKDDMIIDVTNEEINNSKYEKTNRQRNK